MVQKKFIFISLLILLLLGCSFAGCNPKPDQDPEVKTLTLAVFENNPRLSEWVSIYNKNHPEVSITLVNYFDKYSDSFEALKQLKIEIVAGKGPDLIDFSLLYSPIDASSGMLVDLYPLMQNDARFNKQDFYYNILESLEVGDSLYVLAPTFGITSYATTNHELSGLERMDIEQLIEVYNQREDGTILFPGETKSDVLAKICYWGLGNYIDWGNGSCRFNSDSFKALLNFADQFPSTLNITADYSAMNFFTEGRAILYPVSFDNVYGTTLVRMLYGKTPTYIGYPLDSGNGNMAAIADIAIGISATSNNKDEAWDFLVSLLDRDFQDNTESGLPLRINSLKQQLADAMETAYDANGNMVVQEQLIFDGEDPVNIFEISEEDAETLELIISKVEFSATVDSALYSIVLEEADYLFNDDRAVDDVADIIQNRVSLYINENK
ncbi:MAG: extracellular solute-binding protein [Lachnospiraceae bacterium]|jgi:ABC-type glycerol-3-phosphate transport system substrate-binding protein|nr:extracellular solute-binding protein [Lachnospiraceae bacterium]